MKEALLKITELPKLGSIVHDIDFGEQNGMVEWLLG